MTSPTQSNEDKHLCWMCMNRLSEYDDGTCDECTPSATRPTQSDKTVELRKQLMSLVTEGSKYGYNNSSNGLSYTLTEQQQKYADDLVDQAIAALTAREERLMREAVDATHYKLLERFNEANADGLNDINILTNSDSWHEEIKQLKAQLTSHGKDVKT